MPLAAVRETGEGVAAALEPYRDGIVVVVSSDMTHYEAAASAERKDALAIERLKALDAEGLLEVVGELIRYANSGEASGDYDHVVGYAALSFA